MKKIPHRFHQFENPNHAPFDRDDCRWPTIVGEFFAPIVRDADVAAFVFLNHGDHDVELRFASTEYQRVEEKMAALQKALGIKSSASPTDGSIVGDAFGGNRFLATEKLSSKEMEQGAPNLCFDSFTQVVSF